MSSAGRPSCELDWTGTKASLWCDIGGCDVDACWDGDDAWLTHIGGYSCAAAFCSRLASAFCATPRLPEAVGAADVSNWSRCDR